MTLIKEFTKGFINDLLEKVEEFMQPEFAKYRITLENDLDTGLGPMNLDQNLLYRAFLNLFVNSVQAMPDGGTLSVRTFLSPKEKKKVIIMIKDSGFGISKEKLSMIFTHFYTDKNRGTGLGLAIVLNIIEEHNGSITVESEMGKGTTFIITLPQQ